MVRACVDARLWRVRETMSPVKSLPVVVDVESELDKFTPLSMLERPQLRIWVHQTIGVISYGAVLFYLLLVVRDYVDVQCDAAGAACSGPSYLLKDPAFVVGATMVFFRHVGIILGASIVCGLIAGKVLFAARSLVNGRTLKRVMKNAPKLEVVQPADCSCKEDVIFAWDIHGVLVRPSVWLTLKVATSPAYLWNMLFFGIMCASPYSMLRIVSLTLRSEVAEEVFDRFIEDFPYLWRAERAIFRLANSFVPNKCVFDTIAALKEAGYAKHYVFSNIGERIFADLKDIYPDEFATFDGILTAAFSKRYIHKPLPGYYYLFHETFGSGIPPVVGSSDREGTADSTERRGTGASDSSSSESDGGASPASNKYAIVFIDDKKENTRSGRHNGMLSLHYRNTPQLLKDLIENGIDL